MTLNVARVGWSRCNSHRGLEFIGNGQWVFLSTERENTKEAIE